MLTYVSALIPTYALVSKNKGARKIKVYRPITCIYEIITKVLSNRLREVIPSIIEGYQCSFVKGSRIHDGVRSQWLCGV